MTGISELLNELSGLSMPMERTIIYALFYSTLFWLPVRGVAAMLDHWHARHHRLTPQELTSGTDHYCIGKEILPPL